MRECDTARYKATSNTVRPGHLQAPKVPPQREQLERFITDQPQHAHTLTPVGPVMLDVRLDAEASTGFGHSCVLNTSR